MIFVTVGTHEQQFNRLVKKIDELKQDGLIQDDIVIQTGFCTYEPRYCEWKSLFSYEEMLFYVEKADIVITHGGPSSFIMPLQMGKIPVVVPRKLEFNEHVNNHQLDFAREVAKRQGNIIVVENVEELKDTVLNYASLVETLNNTMASNNNTFNIALEKIVATI